MWKDFVEPDEPQMTMWCRCILCWIRTTANTLSICNTYWFSTETLVALMCLNVTLYIPCLYFFFRMIKFLICACIKREGKHVILFYFRLCVSIWKIVW